MQKNLWSYMLMIHFLLQHWHSFLLNNRLVVTYHSDIIRQGLLKRPVDLLRLSEY